MRADATPRPHQQAGLESLVRGIEHSRVLDQPANALDYITQPAHTGPLGSVLRGQWLGHALHPMMTDLSLGCWLSAGLLDLFGGRGSRSARRRLVGLGLVSALPTMASGAAEWPSLMDRSARRVGVIHLVGNVGVAALYLTSWLRRRHDRHLAGALWGMSAGLLALFTGYLGGHLSFGRGVASTERWPTPPSQAGVSRS